ncbi:hypothetical protein Chor_001158 [Crotalus horridus]
MRDILRFLQARRMWEMFSLLLLLTLERSSAEANSTDPSLVMISDSSPVEVSHPGLTVPENQSFGDVQAPSSILDSSEKPPSVLTVKQDERDIKHSTFITQSSATPVTTQQGENITLKTLSREKDRDGDVTKSKALILPKDGGHPAQINPRKGPLEKETPKKPVVSRTSRQSGYSSNSQQAKDNRSPSFETTRGK